MLKFHDAVKVVIEFNYEAISDICGCSHKKVLLIGFKRAAKLVKKLELKVLILQLF